MSTFRLKDGICAGLATLFALFFTGCGTENQTSAASDSKSDAAAAKEAPSPLGEPTPCARLIENGWKAPETEPNITYDNEADVALIEFTDPEDTIVVAPRRDADCAKLVDIGPIIARIGPNQDEITEELCADAVESFNSGRPAERNGAKMDLDSLRELVVQDCPQRFVDRLE